jgi:hypothetical protein
MAHEGRLARRRSRPEGQFQGLCRVSRHGQFTAGEWICRLRNGRQVANMVFTGRGVVPAPVSTLSPAPRAIGLAPWRCPAHEPHGDSPDPETQQAREKADRVGAREVVAVGCVAERCKQERRDAWNRTVIGGPDREVPDDDGRRRPWWPGDRQGMLPRAHAWFSRQAVYTTLAD